MENNQAAQLFCFSFKKLCQLFKWRKFTKNLQSEMMLSVFLLFGIVIFSSSCGQSSAKRTYEEVVSSPEQEIVDRDMSNMDDPQALLQQMIARGEDPHAFLTSPTLDSSLSQKFSQEVADSMSMGEGTQQMLVSQQEGLELTWEVPSGWKEKTSTGMRLASFSSDQSPNLDVSIVSLGAAAGGISANINRWMNQIHLAPLGQEALEQFLLKQQQMTSSEGLPIQMVDFSFLQSEQSTATPSMLAAIVEVPDKTVFVKMVGTLEEIHENRTAFIELCQSLKFSLDSKNVQR